MISRTKKQTAVIVLLVASALQMSQSQACWAQTITVYEKQVIQTIERAHTFHVKVEKARRSPNHVQQNRQLYSEMAKQMTCPAEYAHLKFPEVDPDRKWTHDAAKVARAIKPNLNYQVVKGRDDSVIHGSSEAVKNLYDNVRLIAWYHDELDKNFSDQKKDVGTLALAKLMDEFLETLADAVPRIKIRKSGRINLAKDQKFQYSESKLWSILSVINRYYFYKVQVYPERKDFVKADFMVMNSMIQTAALFGAQPPQSVLRNIDVNLDRNDKGWKGAGYIALDSWEQELNDEHLYPQNVCSISIPPKEQPKKPAKPEASKPPAPKPKPGAFPTDVEDVKEVGGQIFIRRGGKWQLWEKKK